MQQKSLEQVVEWHNAFKVPVLEYAQIPDEKRVDLRISLLKEELQEFIDAAKQGDIVGVADALADIEYVLMGTVAEFGMKDVFTQLFDEVHSSNMSKLDENGKPILREDGKILKSQLFRKPDLKTILMNHFNEKGNPRIL